MTDKFLIFSSNDLSLDNLQFEYIKISQNFQIFIDTDKMKAYKLLPIKNERTVFANQTIYSSKVKRSLGTKIAKAGFELFIHISMVQFHKKPRCRFVKCC